MSRKTYLIFGVVLMLLGVSFFPYTTLASNPCSGVNVGACSDKYNTCVNSGASEASCNQSAVQWSASMNDFSAKGCDQNPDQSICTTDLQAASNASNNLDSSTQNAQAAQQNLQNGQNEQSSFMQGTPGASNIDYNSQTPEGGGFLPNGQAISPINGVNGLQQQSVNGLPPYTPLEPIPGLDQTGNAQFGPLLSQLFKILIIVGSLIAVGSFVYAGIFYMVSEVPGVKVEATKRLTSAMLGLLLLIGSWVILFTINPQLVMFNSALNAIPLLTPSQPLPTVSSDQKTAINQCEKTQGATGSIYTDPTTGAPATCDVAKMNPAYPKHDGVLDDCSSAGAGVLCIQPQSTTQTQINNLPGNPGNLQPVGGE